MTTYIHIVQHLRPGGIETMVLDMLKFSADPSHTYVVSLEGDQETALQQWPRLKAYSNQLIFLNKMPGLSPSLVFELSRVFKSHHTDIVHTHHIGPLLYGGLAAKISAVKHIIHTEHDAWHLNDAQRKRLQHSLIKLINPTIVADANLVAENLKQQLKLKKLSIIHNGIDTDRFIPGNKSEARQTLKLPLNVKLIGCAGRLEEVKGQHILIKALTQLPENVHLAIAGIGTKQSELLKLAESNGLANRVHFLGLLEDMPGFYQTLDVFCLPSLNEGYPLSPLEAQSCGVRSLVTDVGASKETLCRHTGQTVPANNPALMAKALFQMLLEDTTHSPREHVVAHSDIRRMVQRYSALSHQEVSYV